MIDKYHTHTHKGFGGKTRGGRWGPRVEGGFIMAADIWVRRGAGLKHLHPPASKQRRREREERGESIKDRKVERCFRWRQDSTWLSRQYDRQTKATRTRRTGKINKRR
jgi:hypothetical protein